MDADFLTEDPALAEVFLPAAFRAVFFGLAAFFRDVAEAARFFAAAGRFLRPAVFLGDRAPFFLALAEAFFLPALGEGFFLVVLVFLAMAFRCRLRQVKTPASLR